MSQQVDAIGIGCRRCASSFTHDCLNNHPDIAKPERGIHYFSQFAGESPGWYFEQMPDKGNRSILLEYSVSYTYPEYADNAARRIKQRFPDVKLFASVRNPVDRAFSDYLRSIRNREIPHTYSFEQAVDAQPALLERGRYSRVLGPFIDHFSKERLHIMLYDDLKVAPAAFLNPLFRFLGVDENVLPVGIKPRGENGRDLRWPALDTALRGTKEVFEQAAALLGCKQVWARGKTRFMDTYQNIRALNTVETKMSDSMYQRLQSFYADDIEWLAATSGRDLTEWT